MKVNIDRLLLYSSFARQQIVAVDGIFDGDIHYFVVYDSIDYSPSNHSYKTVLRKCKCIDPILSYPQDIDYDRFVTKLDELPTISVSFDPQYRSFRVSS